MRMVRLILTGVFVAAFLGAVVAWIIGVLYFGVEISHTPIVPDAVHGFVYPHNNHGVTHYFTMFDHILDRISATLMFICIPILVVGGMFVLAYQTGKDRHLPKMNNH
jgi:hypothetical protein